MITLPELASDHQNTHQAISVHKKTGPVGASPPWFPHHPCLKVTFHTIQEAPRLFPLCSIALPEDIWHVEVPHKNKGQWLWDFSQLLIEYFICLFILAGWSVSDSHQDMCPIVLTSDSCHITLNHIVTITKLQTIKTLPSNWDGFSNGICHLFI